MINLIIFSVVNIVLLFFAFKFFILAYKALKKYLSDPHTKEEKQIIRRNLGEVLKEYRIGCNMTQEFVAETLGVSRQTISKWETGQTEPSTSNLIAVSKLYGIAPEEILRQIRTEN